MRNPARRQPPVHSPLTPGALLAGAGALLAGDPLERLSAVLAARFQADAVVPCGSGTEALQAALRLARPAGERRRVVALPAFSCYDVATAAVGADAEIALYDVDPGTLAPDLESLERVLEATAPYAVVAACLHGVPFDWEAVEARAARCGAVVIEDAAQGHGATWQGRRLGALGRWSIVSFGRGKGWTGGRGGAVLLRGGAAGRAAELEAGLAPAGRSAGPTTLGTAAAAWALGRPAIYGLPAAIPWLGLGETRYREPVPPRRMSPVAAAIALGTLESADAEAALRARSAGWLQEELRGRSGAEPVEVPAGGSAGYLRFPLRVPGGFDRLPDPTGALRLGIARGYPTTLAELAAVRPRRVDAEPLPGARTLARTLITLPTHSRMRAGELRAALAWSAVSGVRATSGRRERIGA